jgi:hypothetical protein
VIGLLGVLAVVNGMLADEDGLGRPPRRRPNADHRP